MTRPFLLLENASLKEHPINLPLRDGPSGAEALTASGGEGASIAQMYICAFAGVNPCPQCRLRAELLGKRAESPPLCRKVWQQCQNWMRVGVLNSFLRLSNTPTLILWKKA